MPQKKTLQKSFISNVDPIEIIPLVDEAEQLRKDYFQSNKKLSAKGYVIMKGGRADVPIPPQEKKETVETVDDPLLRQLEESTSSG